MLALDENIAIFSCDCHEPGGIVTRQVYPMILTPKNLQTFWDKARKFRSLFAYELGDDFKQFCEVLMSMEGERLYANGLFWLVDDFVGIFYMTHIQAHDAQIHYAFFDRRHHGRQQLTRKMIKYVFDKYKFRRLSAEIPFFAKGTFEFVEQVGLKIEGRKRKSVLFDNEWFDVRCYGVLQEEAQRWE